MTHRGPGQRASMIVAATFMLLVGLSMPPMLGDFSADRVTESPVTRPTVAMLSLALNLLLTGLFILIVKKLVQTSAARARVDGKYATAG